MAVIGLLIRALALLVMYKISNPKIMPLLPPEEGLMNTQSAEVELKTIKVK